MKKPDYHLMPTVGDRIEDVMRTFFGNTERLSSDQEACHDALVRGVSPLLRSRSVYEVVPSEGETCLAIEAGAREGQRVGLDEISQVLTASDASEQKAMIQHLAQGLEPELSPNAPTPTPQYQSSFRR